MTSLCLRTLLISHLALPLLVGCGGGGNELGPADTLQASPQAVDVSGSNCAPGVGPTVHVYGGLPPYTLKNSVPLGMALDRTRMNNSGDGFTITFINGVCMKNMPISVEDDMGRLLDVSITNYQG